MPDEPAPFVFTDDPTEGTYRTYERILGREARRGGFGLLAVAGLTLLLGVLVFSTADKSALAAGLLLLIGGSVLLGLGAWAFQNPFPAVIAGVIVFVALQVAELMLVGGAVLCPGLILSLVTVDSLRAGLHYRRLLRKHRR